MIFVTDWDETATTADTTSVVASVAYKHKPNHTPFSVYTEIYKQALAENHASSVQQEREFQQQSLAAEMASVSAIEQSGLFRGLRLSEFAAMAPQVTLRPGFVEYVRGLPPQTPKYVLSVGWCLLLIRAVLQRHNLEMEVVANELEVKDGVTTGLFVRPGVRTGYDKEQILMRLRRTHGQEVLYVGDSGSDVLAILAADVGVLISGGRGRAVLARYARIRGAGELAVRGGARGGCVVEATWSELADKKSAAAGTGERG